MRVLFCLTSLGAGGTEQSTALLATQLLRSGVDAEIAVLERSAVGYEPEVMTAGIPLHVAASGGRVAKLRWLRRLIREFAPDVVHTAIFDADILGRIASWRSGAVVVSSLINTSYDPARLADAQVGRAKLAAVRTIDGWTARHLTTALHAVSEGVAGANAQHLRLPRSKIHVVERGRDPQRFRPPSATERSTARAGFGLTDAAPVLLAVGRVEFQKGHVHAVEALARLRARRVTANARLLIAGRPGNASPDVDRAVDRHGLTSAVKTLGHRGDVQELLWAADVFVLPSIYEGTAGAAIEAMAVGVPIVAADLTGLTGVMEHDRNALLFPARDAGALAAAVESLLTNESQRLRLAHNARSDFEQRFTLERSGRRMVELYRSLITADQKTSVP